MLIYCCSSYSVIPINKVYLFFYNDLMFPTADDTPPRVTCPAHIIKTDIPRGITGRFIDWVEPTVSDLSMQSDSVIELKRQSHDLNSFFPLGTTVVSYGYEDWAGNKASCRFNVTLIQGKDLIALRMHHLSSFCRERGGKCCV